jgi:hypothetical protein
VVDPEILRRQAWVFYWTGGDPKLRTLARAHQLGLLSDELREDGARRLESSALQDFDLSFFDRKDVLALIPPMDLVSLGIRLRTDLLPTANEQISTTREEADLSEDPESHFERFNDALSTLEGLASSDLSTAELIEEARDAVKAAVADLEERKRAKLRKKRRRTIPRSGPTWPRYPRPRSQPRHCLPTGGSGRSSQTSINRGERVSGIRGAAPQRRRDGSMKPLSHRM